MEVDGDISLEHLSTSPQVILLHMCISQKLYSAIVNVVLHLISTTSSLLFITHFNTVVT